jgi:hypothetical protein
MPTSIAVTEYKKTGATSHPPPKCFHIFLSVVVKAGGWDLVPYGGNNNPVS